MITASNTQSRFFNIDLISVAIFILLVIIGWGNVVSATLSYDNEFKFDLNEIYIKQLLWMGLTIPIILGIFSLNSKVYERFASIFYGISLLFIF